MFSLLFLLFIVLGYRAGIMLPAPPVKGAKNWVNTSVIAGLGFGSGTGTANAAPIMAKSAKRMKNFILENVFLSVFLVVVDLRPNGRTQQIELNV